MAKRESSTLGRRRLGTELRRMREAADKTREEAGERLDCSASKISRIEVGDVGVRRRDLEDLLDLYGITDEDQRAQLFALARASKHNRGWWIKFSDLPNPYLKLIELESVATSLRWFEPMVIPGWLQTEAYMRAVVAAGWPTATAEETERRVKVRLTRQDLLTSDDAPEFWAILDEAALHRRIGDEDVMREQCAHLVEMSELRNLTLQILPFEHGGHEALFGGFTILRFPDPDPDIVFVEGFAGDVYLEKPEDIDRCSLVFDHLNAAALSPPKSLALLKKAAAGKG